MGWPPGFFVHKQAMKVLVDGAPGVQQGHDVGYMIPHFAIPMNALCALNTLFSKHKVMIPVSSVQLQGKPAGTYLLFLLGEICCNPASLPTGIVLLIKCTVWTSPSFWDILKGLAYMAIDAALDLAWNKIFKGSWMGTKVEGFKPFINLSPFSGGKAAQILGLGFALQPGIGVITAMFQGGSGPVARYVLSQFGNKVIDHVANSWFVGPLVTGAPRGIPAVGRGDYTHKFFNEPWW
jgi:hypothetical protein